jgi:hypothetical protein
MHCLHCGREITEPEKAFTVMIVESHSAKLGSAVLHNCCAEPRLTRYRQVIEWHGTIGNVTAFRELHLKIARLNKSSWGSVPILLV